MLIEISGDVMKEMFTFQNFPMTIIVGLIAFAWFLFITIMLAS